MSANLFPHVITLNTKITSNVNGGQVVTYTKNATIAALISPASTALKTFYDTRHSMVTHEINTMTSVSVEIDDVVLFGTRQFIIRGQRNILEGGRLFALDCYELMNHEQIIYDFND